MFQHICEGPELSGGIEPSTAAPTPEPGRTWDRKLLMQEPKEGNVDCDPKGAYLCFVSEPQHRALDQSSCHHVDPMNPPLPRDSKAPSKK